MSFGESELNVTKKLKSMSKLLGIICKNQCREHQYCYAGFCIGYTCIILAADTLTGTGVQTPLCDQIILNLLIQSNTPQYTFVNSASHPCRPRTNGSQDLETKNVTTDQPSIWQDSLAFISKPLVSLKSFCLSVYVKQYLIGKHMGKYCQPSKNLLQHG